MCRASHIKTDGVRVEEKWAGEEKQGETCLCADILGWFWPLLNIGESESSAADYDRDSSLTTAK